MEAESRRCGLWISTPARIRGCGRLWALARQPSSRGDRSASSTRAAQARLPSSSPARPIASRLAYGLVIDPDGFQALAQSTGRENSQNGLSRRAGAGTAD